MEANSFNSPLKRLEAAVEDVIGTLETKADAFVEEERQVLRTFLQQALNGAEGKAKLQMREIRRKMSICLDKVWTNVLIFQRSKSHRHPIQRSEAIQEFPEMLEHLRMELRVNPDELLDEELPVLENIREKTMARIQRLISGPYSRIKSDSSEDSENQDGDATEPELDPMKKEARKLHRMNGRPGRKGKDAYQNTSSGSGRNRQVRMR